MPDHLSQLYWCRLVSRPYHASAQALQGYSPPVTPLARRAKRRPIVCLSKTLAEQFAKVVTAEHRVAAR